MYTQKSPLYKLLLTILLFALTPEVYPESPYKKNIYTSFINRQMYKWEDIIRSMDAVKEPTSLEQKIEHIDYYYGYIAHLIGKKQLEKAEEELPKAEKLVNQLIRIAPKNATGYAYKGAFLGLKIATNKLKSVSLKSESNEYINKALELDPRNVQALIDKGNMLFYSPHMLGGNKREALNYYLTAALLMERNKDTNQNWKYLNLLTVIGIAYEKIDMDAEAKLAFEKLLHKEPNYKLVRDELYPKLLQKLKK